MQIKVIIFECPHCNTLITSESFAIFSIIEDIFPEIYLAYKCDICKEDKRELLDSINMSL